MPNFGEPPIQGPSSSLLQQVITLPREMTVTIGDQSPTEIENVSPRWNEAAGCALPLSHSHPNLWCVCHRCPEEPVWYSALTVLVLVRVLLTNLLFAVAICSILVAGSKKHRSKTLFSPRLMPRLDVPLMLP